MEPTNRNVIRRVLFAVPFVWVGSCLLTGTYADNARYVPGMIPFLLFGSLSSVIALVVTIRGWYHLLALPIWAFLISELLVLAIQMFHP